MKTSQLFENLKGSEIIKIAGEVRAIQADGEKVFNLTIGDFDSEIFPIPLELKNQIIEAYNSDLTNYPAGNGELSLRKSVSAYLNQNLKLDYSENEILISGGARPLIYAVYQTILDVNDTVLYPVPSWNNDAYTYLGRCNEIRLETKAENKFMPTAEEIKPHLETTNLIAVCSPLNPTGTTFEKEELIKICDLIVSENQRREKLDIKPVYLLYDQIYWQLTYAETKHFHPVSLNSKMRNYTIYIDGISKAFAATGVRVGWAMGPADIIHKMKDILSHIGAWAPKPEQIATGKFLEMHSEVLKYLNHIKLELSFRLNEFYKEFQQMKSEGYAVDVIQPEAALYLTVKFDLLGKETMAGNTFENVQDITAFLLKKAKVAVVPFYAFGASEEVCWYRLSVGTTERKDIPEIMENLKQALKLLKSE